MKQFRLFLLLLFVFGYNISYSQALSGTTLTLDQTNGSKINLYNSQGNYTGFAANNSNLYYMIPLLSGGSFITSHTFKLGGSYNTGTDLMAINSLGNVIIPNGSLAIGGGSILTPANRLQITSASTNTSGLRFTNLTSASTLSISNNLGLSVDANGDVILVPAGGANTGAYGSNYFVPTNTTTNTTGYDNTHVGIAAGTSNTIGWGNTFVGSPAGINNTTGRANTFLGSKAGNSNTTGIINTYVGTFAGINGSGTGSQNTFMGYAAGQDNSGNDNTYIGVNSGRGLVNSSYTVCFGRNAGYSGNIAGGGTNLTFVTLLGGNTSILGDLTNATAIGGNAMVSANNSLILGSVSGLNGATASTNVGIGNTAPTNRLEITSATSNTSGLRFTNLKSISTPSTSNNLGLSVDVNGDVILVPASSGVFGQSYYQPSKPASSTGDYNAYVGVGSGYNNTTGYNNALFGTNAGFNNTTGYSNAYFGFNAGSSNNAGYANAIFGATAGQNNSSGFANTLIGYGAGQIGVGGDRNTYLGYASGLNNVGSDNTFIGLGSGRGITSSNLNVCIGKDAGFSGNGNGAGTLLTNVTLIGGLAMAVGNLSNASAIGYNATVSASNSLILGNAVNVGIGNSAPNNKLEITSVTTNTSGLRFTNLKSTSTPSASNSLALSVDANGDVILVPGGGGTLPAGADVWDQLPNGADYLIRNKNNKSVMIGTVAAAKTSIDYKLYVEKGVLSEKFKVSAQANWPDYVFGKNYSLMPLKEVENFIATNNHLPEVPSAKSIEKEGLDLGKMDATLLKKIEELTLYLIEQNKQLSTQQQTISKLQEKVELLEQNKK